MSAKKQLPSTESQTFTDNNGVRRGGVVIEWHDEDTVYVDGMLCKVLPEDGEFSWNLQTFGVYVQTERPGDDSLVWHKIGTIED